MLSGALLLRSIGDSVVATREPDSPVAKYYVIGRLILSTWVCMLGAATFALHAVGIYMITALLDGDTSNDLSPRARAIATALFIVTIVSMINDVVALRHHGRSGEATDAAGQKRERCTSSAAVACDVVLLVVCGGGWYVHGNTAGGATVVAILLLSLLSELRYMRAARKSNHADLAEWHVTSQLLALQHALLVGVAFLISLPLLLLTSLETTPAEVAAQLGSGNTVILSVLLASYAVGLVAAVVLAGLHGQLDAGPPRDGVRRVVSSEGSSYSALVAAATAPATAAAAPMSPIAMHVAPMTADIYQQYPPSAPPAIDDEVVVDGRYDEDPVSNEGYYQPRRA